MFLGQIMNSLRSNSIFKMSSGNQLREYHHIDDILKCIELILKKNGAGIINLNHGKPVRLIDLAQFLFRFFSKEHLLEVDKKNIITNEIHQKLTKHYAYSKLPSRNYLYDIANYFQDQLLN